MKRAIRIAGVLFSLGVIAWIWWAYQSGFFDRVRRPPAKPSAFNQAITHPVAFAENHFTGGIGAILGVDSQSGLAAIRQVVNGSPAQKAGLSNGDVIIKINGTATTGKSLKQIVDEIRGFPGGRITLTVQRVGTTNLEMTLFRRSWSGLGLPIAPSPGALPVPVLPVAPVTPSGSNSPPR
jgi:membrane-associated protease RseP (regulator of RpoE activity)